MNVLWIAAIIIASFIFLVTLFTAFPRIIENNLGKIVVFLLIVFAVEGGIYCWRMPTEFRSEIIPKLQRQISNYDRLVRQFDEDIVTIVVQQRELKWLVDENKLILNIQAADIEKIKVLIGAPLNSF